MEIIEDIRQFRPPPAGVVLTIGNFDGVHVGHQTLIAAVIGKARELDATAAALTFDPHPISILYPHRAPARLLTLAEKLEVLGSMGLDATIILHSTPQLLNETAEEFLRNLTQACRPRVIVEGPTFNFGRGREGNIDTLRAAAARYGYEAVILDELHSPTLHGHPPVNSSTIRTALRGGRVEDARLMLGRPYRITGIVGDGKHLGDKIGFPTANMEQVHQLVPGHAVYAAVAEIEGGAMHLAAVNIGPQPTFDESRARIEAFLLDYSGNLRGRKLGLHFLARLRAQVRFESVAALTEQLHKDVETLRRYAPALQDPELARLPAV